LTETIVGEPGGRTAVLLTEDEALIGLDLGDILEGAGYRVIGPAATIAEALSFMRRETPQMAIIDVRLRDGDCMEIMRDLRQRGVPFVVHSGCQVDQPFAAEFGDAPWLVKPASPRDVLASLGRLNGSKAPC
jgi:DNA-binding response OmpR family regulator